MMIMPSYEHAVFFLAVGITTANTVYVVSTHTDVAIIIAIVTTVLFTMWVGILIYGDLYDYRHRKRLE